MVRCQGRFPEFQKIWLVRSFEPRVLDHFFGTVYHVPFASGIMNGGWQMERGLSQAAWGEDKEALGHVNIACESTGPLGVP